MSGDTSATDNTSALYIASIHLPQAGSGQDGLNARLLQQFMQHHDDEQVRKTHLFNGRYENIYLDSQRVPAVNALLKLVRLHASNILQREDLRIGYWFNHMPPGAITTLHSHDDGYELLSAVYYVNVPDNSGELILRHNGISQSIQPCAGQLIFFAPDLDHEVTVNNSPQHRLSIAFNIGPQNIDD